MWGLAPEVGRKIIAGAFPIKPFQSVLPVTLSGSLGRIGSLEVRLAATRKDVRKAQRLRFKVFFEEGGAIPDAKAALTRRDADKFDAFCDHLIVIDHEGRSRTERSSRRWWAPIACCAATSRRRSAASIRRANSTSRRCWPAIPARGFSNSAAPAS